MHCTFSKIFVRSHIHCKTSTALFRNYSKSIVKIIEVTYIVVELYFYRDSLMYKFCKMYRQIRFLFNSTFELSKSYVDIIVNHYIKVKFEII